MIILIKNANVNTGTYTKFKLTDNMRKRKTRKPNNIKMFYFMQQLFNATNILKLYEIKSTDIYLYIIISLISKIFLCIFYLRFLPFDISGLIFCPASVFLFCQASHIIYSIPSPIAAFLFSYVMQKKDIFVCSSTFVCSIGSESSTDIFIFLFDKNVNRIQMVLTLRPYMCIYFL